MNIYRWRGIVLTEVLLASLVGESRQEIGREALLEDAALK